MTNSQIDTELVALMDLIKGDQFSNTEVRRSLRDFQCPRDSDVEAYLRRYAYTNERLGTSRTYLTLDYAKYDQNLPSHLPPVVAYFTLSVTSTDFSRVEQGVKKDILGFVPKDDSKDHFSGYLLAQIGRSGNYGHDEFDCSDLLVEAEKKVIEAMKLVGGRVIYLDCKNSQKLITLYESNGYSVLDVATEGDHPVKMVKAIAV